jgi:hypothetical protein
VKNICLNSPLAVVAALAVCACAAQGQQTNYEHFRDHNASMTEVQPTWMGPLMQSDSRLSQSLRLSVSNSYSPGAQPIVYGNNHGVTFIAARRFQLEFDPPSFFRNHSATPKDGFGNAGALVKWRIASGNEQHGNYAVSAIVSRSFTPGAYENGDYTGAYGPRIAVGKAFGRFNVQTTIGGVLPTGQIALQGRAIEWNTTAQLHPSAHLYLDIENNATYFKGSSSDGQMQNFMTPAAFYAIRRKNWSPAHAVVVLGGGMQIATSGFYFYNHNLIAEARILF